MFPKLLCCTFFCLIQIQQPTFSQLIVTQKVIPTVRVGVTLYPAYVEPCVLREKNLFNVKCKDPGWYGIELI